MKILFRLNMCILFLALTACSNSAIPTEISTLPASTAIAPPTSLATRAPVISPTSPTATLPASLMVLTGHSSPVTNVVWSPNGQFLATSAGRWDSTDPTIRLWRADGTVVKVLSGQSPPVTALAWSSDSQVLASGSDDTITLWKANGTLIARLHSAGYIQALAWSPDGQPLAAALMSSLGPFIQLWQRDGTLLSQLSTQNSGGKFFNLGWSPDGQFLLAGSIDYKVWRADGTEVFHLKKCSNCTPAWGMAWSPDSQRWAIGDESGNVDVYDIEGNSIIHLQNTKGNAMRWHGRRTVKSWQAATELTSGRRMGVCWLPMHPLVGSTAWLGRLMVNC